MSTLKRVIKHISRKREMHNYFKHNSKKVSKKLTLISNDCCGGVLYHQMNRKFLTPTINLYFDNEDFLNFCANITTYMKQTLIPNEEKTKENGHVVGTLSPKDLKPVSIHFLHYSTFDNALAKWNKRRKRINYSNLIILFNLTNITNNRLCEQTIQKFNSKISNFKTVFLTRFDYDNINVIKIDFYNSPYIHAQVVSSPNNDYKRYIDQAFETGLFKTSNL